MSRQRLVQVYRSARRDELYLIVDRRDGLAHVPQPLLEQFGRPEASITFLLTPDRELARADAAKVLAALDEQGFYLQMPPPADTPVERGDERP